MTRPFVGRCIQMFPVPFPPSTKPRKVTRGGLRRPAADPPDIGAMKFTCSRRRRASAETEGRAAGEAHREQASAITPCDIQKAGPPP